MTDAPPVLVRIRPSAAWPRVGWAELWEYRELLYFLVWRDVKIRYKQAVLGAAWAILQPLLTALVFTVFFGRIAGVSSDGAPYAVFSYAGLLPWLMFADAVGRASESLVSSANLVRKVYFPRLLMPASAVAGALVDFAISLATMIVLLTAYGIRPGPVVLLLPAAVLLALGTALGVGTWLAALNAQYRDVRYLLPFLVQLWMFVTPVIYPTSAVVSALERAGLPGWLYGLNPMAGVVEGFRAALLGSAVASPGLFLASAVSAVLILVTGVLQFRRMERTFADVL